jgi:hypothetical protein
VNLKGLTQLRTLNLDKAGLLPPLPPAPELGGAGLNDIEAERPRFPEATRLPGPDFQGPSIGDAGLAQLQGLSRLQGLYLDSTAVSDSGLVHLKALAQLKILSLRQTDVSDAGLNHLKQMTQLKELDLAGTDVSAAGASALRQALPKTEVGHHKLRVID